MPDGAGRARRLGRGRLGARPPHHRRGRPVRRAAGVDAGRRRAGAVGVVPGAGRGGGGRLRRDRPAPRRLRAVRGRRRRPGRGRRGGGRPARLPLGQRRPDGRRRDRPRRGRGRRARTGRLDPGDDVHATAAYRAQLVRVLTRRVLAAATDHARGRREPADERGAPRRTPPRQRRHPRRPGAGPPAALRRAAPRLRPHRHPRRLRARRLRRLHGPARRPAGAVVPDARGLRRGRRAHHRRGARTPRGRRHRPLARSSRPSPTPTASSAASAPPASSPRSPPGSPPTPTPPRTRPAR